MKQKIKHSGKLIYTINLEPWAIKELKRIAYLNDMKICDVAQILIKKGGELQDKGQLV